MNRQIIILANSLITIGMLLLGGCGGSGSSAPPTTVVSGIASKGPIKNGTVKIYAVSAAGLKSATPLAIVQTDANGSFSADLGSYNGAVITEAYGVYADEATGNQVTIPADAPLKTAVALVDNSANNNRKIAITPMTNLACDMMGSTYTPTAIADANNRVGDLFKVPDIVGTLPVQPVTTVVGAASDDQKIYTMALATLSQMAKDTNGGAGASYDQIQAMLNSFKTDIVASNGLGSTNKSAFSTALSTVATTILPGLDVAAANLRTAGASTFKLTVQAASVPGGTLLGALHGVITVPAGVDMRKLATGQVLSGLITATGTAATGTSQVMGSFNSTTRQLSFDVISPSAGFGNGDCAVIAFDVSGTPVTAADFIVTSAQGKDYTTAATVSGVAISLK